jgi:hypothetical protein
MKVIHPTPLKAIDEIVAQKEVIWNGEAPRVVECDGEHYAFSYSIHEEKPDNTKELWHCYRPTTFLDATSSRTVAWSKSDGE